MKKKLTLTLVATVLITVLGMAQSPAEPSVVMGGHSQAMVSAKACDTTQQTRAVYPPSIRMQQCHFLLMPSPQGDRIVVIDSIDNAIDVVMRAGDTLVRVGRYVVDQARGRHDVANIIRPTSIEAISGHIAFCASAINDLGKVGILSIGEDTVVATQVIDLTSHAHSMAIQGNELVVTGSNPQGYNIHIFQVEEKGDVVSIVPVLSHLYRVPKQSERIQASDPVGVGLTIVAICVVFIALVIITLIIGSNAKLIKWTQKRRARKVAISAGKPVETVQSPAETTGEVYAAIAAAIYLYQSDMHDEENTVLTINKVERAWTPWNAKFYNMNQYFNTRTRK